MATLGTYYVVWVNGYGGNNPPSETWGPYATEQDARANATQIKVGAPAAHGSWIGVYRDGNLIASCSGVLVGADFAWSNCTGEL